MGVGSVEDDVKYDAILLGLASVAFTVLAAVTGPETLVTVVPFA